MLDRHAEEAGEAKRLCLRADGLERPAYHLRAHVDAEGGLHHRALRADLMGVGRSRLVQISHELALIAELERGQQDVLDMLWLGRRLGGRLTAAEAFADLAPARGQLRAGLVLEDQHVPGEADRQQLDDGLVLAADQLLLPTQQAGPGGPAADIHQRCVHVVKRGLGRNPETADGRLDAIARRLRQRLDPSAHAALTHHRGAVVHGGEAAPGGVQRHPGPGSLPGRLAHIEVGGAVVADPLDDEA